MVEKIIDLIGVSANSIEDAVQIALARAGVTIKGIHYAHIEDVSAIVENNQVAKWRVAIKVSFQVKDTLHAKRPVTDRVQDADRTGGGST
jgi:flavin-binding protein dodecin